MDERIKTELDKDYPEGGFYSAMLSHCKGLVSGSRSRMREFYEDWNHNADVYRGKVDEDKDDHRAARKNEPGKQSVPLTFAQVQTWVAFCFLLYTQNQNLFTLEPTGDEDFTIRDDAENLLNRDVKRNRFLSTLYQFLLDTGRFNLGVIKYSWKEEYTHVPKQIVHKPASFLGVSFGQERIETVVQEVLRFQGNEIVSVSPFKFFPDIRLPIHRFQKGEFCASETEITVVELRAMEANGEVAGIKHISDESSVAAFSLETGRVHTSDRHFDTSQGTSQSKGKCILTEVQVRIVPANFKINGEPLGTETYPVLYNVWYVNDRYLVKCEPMNYLHGNFTYAVGQFAPDQHEMIGPGLCDIIDYLQATVTWFINSHIASVRKVISNKLVVDPAGVEVKSLESGSPVIYLKKNKSSSGVDRWIKQLQVHDVTSGHMADADTVGKMIQIVTGVNDNAMGQYNSGRRSATESRVVTAGAASRLKTAAVVLWDTALAPLGSDLITNLRQGIEFETFLRCLGRPDTSDIEGNARIQLRFDRFKGEPEELVGNDDFFIFDSTLPSEKGFIAQSLQELLSVIMANPETMQALDYNPKVILDEIMTLRGIKNLNRFSLSRTMQQAQIDQQKLLEIAQQQQQEQQAQSGDLNNEPSV